MSFFEYLRNAKEGKSSKQARNRARKPAKRVLKRPRYSRTICASCDSTRLCRMVGPMGLCEACFADYAPAYVKR